MRRAGRRRPRGVHPSARPHDATQERVGLVLAQPDASFNPRVLTEAVMAIAQPMGAPHGRQADGRPSTRTHHREARSQGPVLRQGATSPVTRVPAWPVALPRLHAAPDAVHPQRRGPASSPSPRQDGMRELRDWYETILDEVWPWPSRTAVLSPMPCGHPLAARAISVVDGRLITICWACAVEGDIAASSPAEDVA